MNEHIDIDIPEWELVTQWIQRLKWRQHNILRRFIHPLISKSNLNCQNLDIDDDSELEKHYADGWVWRIWKQKLLVQWIVDIKIEWVVT